MNTGITKSLFMNYIIDTFIKDWKAARESWEMKVF